MLTVSNYHYIREDFTSQYPSIFGLKPDEFKKQLVCLKNTGDFISYSSLATNCDEILISKQNYYLVTFDDGLKEQFDLALPILDSLAISALFFINSINFIEKKVSLVHKIHLVRSIISPELFMKKISNFDTKNSFALNETEIKNAINHYNFDDVNSACVKYLLNFKLSSNQLSLLINSIFKDSYEEKKIVELLYMTNEQLTYLADNFMLGSHTHSHLPLGLMNEIEIETEITKTKDFIYLFKNNSNLAISYPYGSKEACQTPVSEIAERFGHKIGFTMERGINKGSENKLLLKRFDCNDLPMGKNYKGAYDY